MTIIIVPYKPAWRDEFSALGGTLRRALGQLALRIDHIGSTAVPGLAAKDRIDIQVTVAELAGEVEQALNRIGYKRIVRLTQDHLPPGSNDDPREWSKWVFEPPPGQRPTNLHVRVAGRPNQRYALLFRDYLRAHPATAEAYARVKSALANYHGDDVQAYYDVKDPVCDIIIAGAEDWARTTRWEPGASDC
ncbi:MAG TPA: GrpB family protein [Anaerolineae bacterium]